MFACCCHAEGSQQVDALPIRGDSGVIPEAYPVIESAEEQVLKVPAPVLLAQPLRAADQRDNGEWGATATNDGQRTSQAETPETSPNLSFTSSPSSSPAMEPLSRSISSSTPDMLDDEDSDDVPPVIFLDVDGVLNHDDDPPRSERPLNTGCLKQLGRLMRRCPQAVVVVSSTWRHDRRLLDKLLTAVENEAAIDKDRFIGQTPVFRARRIVSRMPQGASREQEIAAWLKKHPEVTRWVVLDDLKLNIKNHVWVNPGVGLSEDNIDAAEAILRGGGVVSV